MKILLPKEELAITMTKTFFMTEIIEFKDKIAQQLDEVKYFNSYEESEKFTEDYNKHETPNCKAVTRYEFERFPFNLQK